ncbi:MAG: hypothetical protein KY476_18005 [Planctomycetes bacterium]|nr:hypothetical protein [Planctomycetota bacterium]
MTLRRTACALLAALGLGELNPSLSAAEPAKPAAAAKPATISATPATPTAATPPAAEDAYDRALRQELMLLAAERNSVGGLRDEASQAAAAVRTELHSSVEAHSQEIRELLRQLAVRQANRVRASSAAAHAPLVQHQPAAGGATNSQQPSKLSHVPAGGSRQSGDVIVRVGAESTRPTSSEAISTDAVRQTPLEIGAALFRSGDVTAAEKAFRLSAEGDLSAADRLAVEYMIACCLRKQDRPAEALAMYRRVASEADGPLAESARWQIETLEWKQSLETRLGELRKLSPPTP